MNAQSIDIKETLSKAQLIERLYQSQKQQPDTEQQNFASTISRDFEEKNHKTPAPSETEEGKVQLNNEDTLSLSYKKKKKKKQLQNKSEAKESSSASSDSALGQIIDISI